MTDETESKIKTKAKELAYKVRYKYGMIRNFTHKDALFLWGVSFQKNYFDKNLSDRNNIAEITKKGIEAYEKNLEVFKGVEDICGLKFDPIIIDTSSDCFNLGRIQTRTFKKLGFIFEFLLGLGSTLIFNPDFFIAGFIFMICAIILGIFL